MNEIQRLSRGMEHPYSDRPTPTLDSSGFTKFRTYYNGAKVILRHYLSTEHPNSMGSASSTTAIQKLPLGDHIRAKESSLSGVISQEEFLDISYSDVGGGIINPEMLKKLGNEPLCFNMKKGSEEFLTESEFPFFKERLKLSSNDSDKDSCFSSEDYDDEECDITSKRITSPSQNAKSILPQQHGPPHSGSSNEALPPSPLTSTGSIANNLDDIKVEEV